MKITKTSPLTGISHTLDIPSLTQEMLDSYHTGKLIQQAMPNLTPDEREFLMTGITAQEWFEYVK